MPELAITREVGRDRGFLARAGERCLDLVNTVAWRLDPSRRQDRLPDDAAALAWATAFGVCTEEEAALLAAQSTGALSAELRSTREHVHAAVIDGDPEGANALLELDRDWWGRVELERADGSWRTRERFVDHRSVALRLGHEAVRILLEEPAPVKQCADEACGWIYLDTSPRRNRRWCSAEDCGAKNRSRDHYRRTRRSPRS
ncbi:CGNR zinc finger domain-containing protein [Microlunatus sp. GCM10028923]|uniref:CGNR zinc finger domain-containing protein n=1 Tax=Microlunatus sp. GCM10028923 TaxID=3273400 RepID=UPI00360FEF07